MTMATFERLGFVATVEGIDKYVADVRRMQEETAKEEAAVKKTAATHQTASQQVQAANEKTAASAEKLGASSGGIGQLTSNLIRAAAAAASTYVSFRLLEGAIDTTQKLGEQVRQLSLTTGLTAEQSSQLIFSLEHMGISSDSASRGFNILMRNMLQVQETEDGMINAATPAAKVLSSLGIAALDSGGKVRPLAELLPEIADKFQNVLTPAQRAGVAMQLFGRSGAELIPFLIQGPEGIRKLADESDRLGNTLSQKQVDDIHNYTIAQKEFQAVLKSIEIEVATAVMPTLTDFGHWFAEHRDDIANFVQSALQYIGQFATDFVQGLQLIQSALSWIPDHQGDVIAAVAAIGAAMVLAWGPESAAVAGVVALIALLGKVKDLKSDNELPALQTERAELLRQIDVSKTRLGEQPPGFESGSQPGGGSLRDQLLAQKGEVDIPAETQRLQDLSDRFNVVDARIEVLNKPKPPEDKTTRSDTTAIPNAGLDFQNLTKDAKATHDPLQQMAADFVKTGVISRELAEKLGLTGPMAGQVEGIDAVIRAQDDAKDKAFAFSETLGKVAEAFLKSSKVADDIVLDLSQKALEAENRAAGDVLGRPTQESAALDLKEAQLKLQSDLVHARVDPQLDILKKKSEQIQKDTDDQVAGIEQQIKAIQSQPARASSLPPGVRITTGIPLPTPVDDPQQMAINALKAEEAQIKKTGDDRKKAADAEIANLEKQTSSIDDSNKVIQSQITIERDHVDIMRKELTLQDHTLLTDEEQRQKVHELSGEIAKTSTNVRDLSTTVGKDVVPSMDKARDAFDQATAAMDVLTNDSIRKKLIKEGFDPAAERVTIFAHAVDTATTALGGLDALGLANLKAKLAGPPTDKLTGGVTGSAAGSPISPPGVVPFAGFFSEGGYIDRPSIAMVHARELIMPLSNIGRSQELFAQLPSGFRAQLIRGAGGNSFSVAANAQGFTLDDMRAAAHAAVDEAFLQARSSNQRSGSALSGRIG